MSATVLEMEAKRNQGQATLAAGPNEAATLVEDEALYEVEYGRVVEKRMAYHTAQLATELCVSLGIYLREQKQGRVVQECLFILDAERNLRRRPDVAFVSAQRWPLHKPLPAEGDAPVVPDLVVEVASPRDLLEKTFGKIREYFHYGVREVWLVLPMERLAYVFSSMRQVRGVTAGEELDGGEVLPGFRLKLSELFAAVPVETTHSLGASE
ncbi:hypothetical protein HRbin36_01069 [bacterium HR36]|nr:hypothetical protein HRbin36_01069 [bacterium HR36]